MIKLKEFKAVLNNKSFRWLYFLQAINLLGDSISWTGIALLSYNIAGENSSKLLSIALTIRVLAFVMFSSYVGILADKFDRKKLMILTHVLRMVLISFLAFAYESWHLYVFVFLFSILHSIYTPTFKATIPLIVKDKDVYPKAISLSSATYQVLGILGPGLAGIILMFLSLKYVFWIDGLTFLISIICVLMVPAQLKVNELNSEKKVNNEVSLKVGTQLLFKNEVLKRAVLF